jgi:hypothetical protein
LARCGRLPPARSQSGNLELGYPVGVTTYTGFFTDAELRQIEKGADATDADARNGKYDEVPNTYQCTRKGDRYASCASHACRVVSCRAVQF